MKQLALLGLLVVFAGCSTAAGGPQPAGGAPDGPGGLPKGVRQLDVAAPAGGCIGDSDSRLAVLEVATGADFHAILPGALGTPELDSVKAPVTVVVYRTGWPGPKTGRVGSQPKAPKASTWDVCVSRPDGGDIGGLPFIVYESVRADGSSVAGG